MYNRPYYHKLYADMIRDKYPENEQICSHYLKKENWTALDVIRVNELLFPSEKRKKHIETRNRHRAYDVESIKKILCYQHMNKLNNNQLASHFVISRNTIAKWKKMFQGDPT